MSAPRSILSNGYVALDVIMHRRSVQQSAGGTAANVAANLAHLGWRSRLVARIGKDGQARRIVSDLKAAGVATDLLIRDSDVDTPVVVHRVLPPKHSFDFKCPACGRPSPRFRAVGLEQLGTAGVEPGLVDDVNVVFVDRASAFGAGLLARAFQRGALTVFEPSSRGTEALSREAADHARILKWSEETKPNLHPSTLAGRGGQLQIETMGRAGLRYRVGTGGWTALAPPASKTIDTAGAGDWLTAALLNALPNGHPASLGEDTLPTVLGEAQSFAALSCKYVGARTLARLPVDEVRRAARRLLDGEDLSPPRIPSRRRSRASQVCRLCLAPCWPALSGR